MNVCINAETLTKVAPCIEAAVVRNRGEFTGQAGDEHYRLLAALSSSVSDRVIIDIGTLYGSSAVALACGNPTNTVHTFDIVDHADRETFATLPNVNFRVADLWTPSVRAAWKDTLLSAAIIVLDIDPHEGSREAEFCTWLLDNNFAGIIVCDDIRHFPGMRRFWAAVPDKVKTDITQWGHWSGTGLIANPDHVTITVEARPGWVSVVGLRNKPLP